MAECDCDYWHSEHRWHCATNYPEGVGTGAGEGATGQDTGTAWVTRSADYPEAPAQARPLGPDGFTPLVIDADYRAAFYRVLERCEELKTSVTEHQWNALEMARKADQAERRAEGTEAELERLKAAADLVGHQAACLVDPCDCWMSDLAPLLDYERTQWAKVAEVEQGEGADTWTVAAFKEQPREHASDCACWPPYDSCSHPAHPPCACDGCIGAQCDHQWIDRPESDTVLCDLCGAER